MSNLRRILPDGRIVELIAMIYNVRICVTLPENDGMFYEDMWCFTDPTAGAAAYADWNGEGEPAGWNKHPPSGRWRQDGTVASEINQRDPVAGDHLLAGAR